MSETIIKLENVNFWYEYKKENEFQALKNINFEIEEGDFVGVLGPSGCGKTTLLYVLGGIEKPQEGNVFVLGKNLVNATEQELAVYRQIAVSFIFQQFNLIPSIKAIDNIMLPMAFLGIDEEKRIKRAKELLDKLGILSLKDRYPHELSGGQQQRVAIARALANDPPIILADEPIGNLDTVNAKNVLNILTEINRKEKKTIIMVTHQAWTLKNTVNKIFLMKDGEIIKMMTKKLIALPEVKQIGASYYYKDLFPHLSEKEIYSRLLGDLFLRGYSNEEIERFSSFILKLLNKEIDIEEFKRLLDLPFNEGGLGLWRQKANKITDKVQKILEARELVQEMIMKLENNPEDSLSEEIDNLTNYILGEMKNKLTPIQLERFKEILYERLRNIITTKSFLKILDASIKKGGVGLKTRTVFKIEEKLEEILGEKK